MPSHQTIYFYSKTDDSQYNQLFEDYSPSTNIDQILPRRRRDAHGKAVYDRDEAGQVIHDGHKPGVPVADVTVLDPFGGSGTTLVAAELLGRKSLGVDVSAEAVALARTRLIQPAKTSSGLLRKGRDSCVQCDDHAMAHLRGLQFVPVQRNRGIDAIVRATRGSQPILIRFQSSGVRLGDAAQLVHRAGRSKQPAQLILIATEGRAPANLFDDLPVDVTIITSTAKEVVKQIAAAQAVSLVC